MKPSFRQPAAGFISGMAADISLKENGCQAITLDFNAHSAKIPRFD